MKNVLIFTIATGGYHWLYRNNIESQRQYASKYGYTYSVVDRPQVSLAGKEIVWLKLYLIAEALKNSYDWVVFLDADTEVKPRCPDIVSLDTENKSIYMANGYSNRVNSGVLIFRNDRNSREFIKTVCENHLNPIPEHDSVGWGENGHVIHYAKNNKHVKVLDKKWNNNSHPDLQDYIRHYSAGPLRKLYKHKLLDGWKFQAFRIYSAFVRRLAISIQGSPDIKVLMYRACASVIARDSAFSVG